MPSDLAFWPCSPFAGTTHTLSQMNWEFIGRRYSKFGPCRGMVIGRYQ